MTIERKRSVLERISKVAKDIEELKRVRVELATNGYASASLNTSSGGKSYTKIDIPKITELIKELEKELTQLQNLLLLGTTTPFKHIYTIYC